MFMRLTFIPVMLLFVFGCSEKKKNGLNQLLKKEIVTEKTTSENFKCFLEKFATDPAFRISRVSFPLEGFNSDQTNVNSTDRPYLWEREDWLFYSEEDFKNPTNEDVVKTATIKTDTTVTFRIYKENSGYDIQYKFKENNKQWFLVYYSYKNF